MVSKNDREFENDLVEKESDVHKENKNLFIFSRNNINSFIYTMLI